MSYVKTKLAATSSTPIPIPFPSQTTTNPDKDAVLALLQPRISELELQEKNSGLKDQTDEITNTTSHQKYTIEELRFQKYTINELDFELARRDQKIQELNQELERELEREKEGSNGAAKLRL